MKTLREIVRSEIASLFPEESAEFALPNGRKVSVQFVYDIDSGIGRWTDGPHHDDVFGTFESRGRCAYTGEPGGRPDGFDGRARVIHGDSRGEWEGDVWWQPPVDVTGEQVDDLLSVIQGYTSGEWCHIGIVVETVPGNYSALHGVEFGSVNTLDCHVDIVVDLLHECGVDEEAMDLIASNPDLANLKIC